MRSWRPAPASLRIRRVRKEDIPVLYKLGLTTPELALSDGRPFASYNDFQRTCRNKQVRVFVARVGKRVVGFSLAEIEGQSACLRYLTVAAPWRRRGIGRRLFDSTRNALAKAKVTHAGLFSWDRPEVVSYFLKLGFQPSKRFWWLTLDLPTEEPAERPPATPEREVDRPSPDPIR